MEGAFIIIILQELNGLPVVYCFVDDIFMEPVLLIMIAI